MPISPATNGASASTRASASRIIESDERERAAAYRVLHLQSQQGVAGDPGGAGAEAQHDDEQGHHNDVLGHGDPASSRPERISASPNSRRRDNPVSSRGPSHMPDGESEEHRPEQDAVTGVSGMQILDVDPGQPDHHAACRERSDDADDEAAYDRRVVDVGPPRGDGAPQALDWSSTAIDDPRGISRMVRSPAPTRGSSPR